MKIIGIAENSDELIIKAKKDEVAQIIGFYYSGSRDCPELKPGKEINVSQIYKRYHQLVSNKTDLKTIKEHCNAILDSIKIINPIIDSVPDEVIK